MTLKNNVKLENILYDYIKNNNIFNLEKVVVKIKLNNNFYRKKTQSEIFKIAKYKFSLINKTVFINNNTLESIHVSNGDIKESLAKALRNNEQKQYLSYHVEIFRFLDKIIANGILISKENELKERSQFLSWEYYISYVIINNTTFLVQFDVVLRINGTKHFRIERIFDLNKLIKKQEVPTEKILINQ